MARESGFGSYRARLAEVRSKRDRGIPARELDSLAKGIRNMPHPTVWQEMKRQGGIIAELGELFGDVPEALGW